MILKGIGDCSLEYKQSRVQALELLGNNWRKINQKLDIQNWMKIKLA